MSYQKKDLKALALGILLAISYKFWKLLCLKFSNDYQLSQLFFSFFRLVATLVALNFIKSHYVDELKFKLSHDNKKSILYIFSYCVVLFVCFYYQASGFSFTWSLFGFEFFINSFVGFFEEFIFRGLVFLSLKRILGFRWSMILSAFLFSIWHYDVIEIFSNYFSIFFFGIWAAILVENGFNFFYIILIHTMTDTIFFGFNWVDLEINLKLFDPIISSVYLLWAVILVKLFKKPYLSRACDKLD